MTHRRATAILCLLAAAPGLALGQAPDPAAERARLANERIQAEAERQAREEQEQQNRAAAPVAPVPASAPSRAPAGPAGPTRLLIAVDALWTLADWAAFAWIVTIPLSFAAVFIPCFLIQHHLKGDTRGGSFAVAAVLGVLAAIPTPVAGTITGTLILALAGIRSLWRR